MKIVVIAPYPGLKNLIQSTIKAEEDIDIQVEVGDLHEGVQIAKKAEKNGADIIISRGGTAELIQKSVEIPVIEIELSAFDLLRVLTLVKDNPLKKAILGFSKVIENAETLCQLLDIEISTYIITNEEEVLPKLTELQKKNYQFIIGDAVTIRYAQELGMNGVLLTSGKESVLKAFEEARKINNILTPLLQTAEIPQSLFNESSMAFLVTNESGTILYKNKTANLLFQSPDLNSITTIITDIFKHEKIDNIIEIDKKAWRIKGEHIRLRKQSYALVTLSHIAEINIHSISGIYMKPPHHNMAFYNLNSTLSKLIKNVEVFKQYGENIWLDGEQGTEKDQLAYFIHLESSQAQNTFLTIDCKLVNENSWKKILDNNGMQNIFFVNNNGTIYLKNVEYLSSDNQKLLFTYLQDESELPRIISSASHGIKEEIANGRFAHDLYYLLSQIKFTIPPLRERQEDLEGLIQIYINTFNFEYGKQIAGIRPEALDLMKQYGWPGNLDELIQVIKEAVLLIEGPFIQEEEIKKILQKSSWNHSTRNSIINLNGTLKEIEKEIIHYVFLEEGENHSKTAERLGINRSTLWRKLKEL